MHDFFFLWVNGGATDYQAWIFPESGNYFELAPFGSRREESQYEVSDRILVVVNNKARATLELNANLQWTLLEGAPTFDLKIDGQSVTLTCTL